MFWLRLWSCAPCSCEDFGPDRYANNTNNCSSRIYSNIYQWVLEIFNSSSLIAFAAFLVRHLPAIAPKVIVFVYNNETAHLANHISLQITGYEQLILNINIDGDGAITTINECALSINFINRETKRVARFGLDKREICF